MDRIAHMKKGKKNKLILSWTEQEVSPTTVDIDFFDEDLTLPFDAFIEKFVEPAFRRLKYEHEKRRRNLLD